MMRRFLLIAAVAGVVSLAGCGGAGTSKSSTAADVVTISITNPASAPATSASATSGAAGQGSTTAAKSHAQRSGTISADATTQPTASTSRASAGTSTATREPAATPKPKPKSPTPCMVRAGLLHVGPAPQTGTWQGTDPANHLPIYVDGPYKSTAAAKQAVSTLAGVNQAAPGGVGEVSAALRGGTGPAVRRVAGCLNGGRS